MPGITSELCADGDVGVALLGMKVFSKKVLWNVHAIITGKS